MSKKSKEKLNVYLCDRRTGAFNLLRDDCLVLAHYGRDSNLAWFHNKVFFQDGKYKEYFGGPAVDKIEAMYKLGGFYYDFVKGMMELGIRFNERE